MVKTEGDPPSKPRVKHQTTHPPPNWETTFIYGSISFESLQFVVVLLSNAVSPFHVRIQGNADVSKVRCYGHGLEPNKVRASVPATFVADTSLAGNAPIEVCLNLL